MSKIRPRKRYELPLMQHINDTSPVLVKRAPWLFAADDELDFFCSECQGWVRIIKQPGQKTVCIGCGAVYRFTKKGNIKEVKKG